MSSINMAPMPFLKHSSNSIFLSMFMSAHQIDLRSRDHSCFKRGSFRPSSCSDLRARSPVLGHPNFSRDVVLVSSRSDVQNLHDSIFWMPAD